MVDNSLNVAVFFVFQVLVPIGRWILWCLGVALTVSYSMLHFGLPGNFLSVSGKLSVLSIVLPLLNTFSLFWRSDVPETCGYFQKEKMIFYLNKWEKKELEWIMDKYQLIWKFGMSLDYYCFDLNFVSIWLLACLKSEISKS